MKFAVIGTGGFAGTHHRALQNLEKQGVAELVATCDIGLCENLERQDQLDLRERGVSIYNDYREMLRAHHQELTAVIIPTPIPLHAEMHREAVQLGIPVYLEKPPTLDYSELEQMLQVEKKAHRATNVGFNFIIDPVRQQIKQRILNGDFGPVEAVSFLGLWPRKDSYFARNNWAGRLFVDDTLVADSGLGNALAHFLHNSLFWAGTKSLFDWGQPREVIAQAYRAHEIESADTFFTQINPLDGPPIRLAVSHAYCGKMIQTEKILCQNAVIHYDAYGDSSIHWKEPSKDSETLDHQRSMFVTENLLDYGAYVLGQKDRPQTRLADTIPFVQSYNLTFLASGTISPIPPAEVEKIPDSPEPGANYHLQIKGLTEAATEFTESGEFPSPEKFSWARPEGRATPDDLPRFRSVLQKMSAQTSFPSPCSS